MSILVAEYDQTFVGHQDYDSARKTAIRDLYSTDWSKKYHV